MADEAIQAKDVFISYSRLDEVFTRKLFDRLQAEQRKPWVDWGGIPLTADWWNEIQEGIRAADTFVFVLSNNSLKSPVCHLEVAYAISNNKRIVPLVTEEKISPNEAFGSIASYDPDEAMQERLEGRDLLVIARDNWKTLSKLNYVFLYKADRFEQGVKSLLAALNTDLEYVKAHTALLTDAHQWNRGGQNESDLLRGDSLAHAEAWLASSGGKEPKPTELQTQYIVASRQAETRRQQQALTLQRRATNRTRAFLGSLALLLIVGISLSLFALVNLQAAQVASAQSESVGIAASALLQNDVGQSELTALLSIRALRSNYTVQAETALARALDNLSTVRVFGGHEQRVRTVAFSPDSRIALTGSYDERIRLWDVVSGSLLRELTMPQAIMDSAFSPDGSLIAAVDYDANLGLWESATGTQRFLVGRGAEGSLFNGLLAMAVAFSPDAAELAVGYVTGEIKIVDAASGRDIRFWQAHRDWVSDLVYSADGSHLYSSSGDGMIRAWNPDSMEEERRYTGHIGDVMALDLSSDDTLLISGSADETIRLWDVASGAELRQFQGHTDTVRSLAFSPDDRFIVSGGLDNIGRVWDVNSGQMIRSLVGHGAGLDLFPADERDHDATSAIFSVAYLPDGRYLLTGGWDGLARLWSNQERRFDAHEGAVYSVAFSPDSRYLLSGGRDTTVRLWDIVSSQPIRQYPGNQYAVYEVGFSTDGHYVYSVGRDGAARLWITETGQGQSYFPTIGWDANVSPTLYSADLSADGRTLVTANELGQVQLWDLQTNQLVNTLDLHLTSIYGVEYAPDESYLLTAGSGDALAKVWSFGLQNDARWFSTHPASGVWSAAYSPAGDYVVIGFEDSTARLFNVAEYREDVVYSGHTDTVTSVAFSPDGQYVLTGSMDRSARLWDRASGEEIRRLVGHTDAITDVAYSPDGRWIATASRDGTFRLWDADYHSFIQYACQHLFRDLTAEERALFSLPDTPTCGQLASAVWTPIPTHPVAPATILPTVLPTSTPIGYIDQYNSPEAITHLRFTPDGRYLALATAGVARILNAHTLTEVRTIEGVSDVMIPPNRFEISPDSNYLTISVEGFPIRAWDIRTGLPRLTLGAEGGNNFFTYSPDSRAIVTPEGGASEGCCVLLWDISDGSSTRFDLGYSGIQPIVRFAPDGNIVAVLVEPQTIALRDLATETEVARFSMPFEQAREIAFSPDGSRLAALSGQQVIIWDVGSGSVLQTFAINANIGWWNTPPAADISVDGRYIVVGSDAAAILYDLQTGHPVQTISNPTFVGAIAFAPDGRSIAIGTNGGTIYRWIVAP